MRSAYRRILVSAGVATICGSLVWILEAIIVEVVYKTVSEISGVLGARVICCGTRAVTL